MTPEDRRRVTVYTMQAVMVHCLIGALSAIVISNQFHVFGRNLTGGGVCSDPFLYFDYATKVLAGHIPYRDFAIEYPILALPLFLLPALVARNIFTYVIALMFEVVLIDAVAVFLVASVTAKGEGLNQVPKRLTWYTLFLLALSPLVFARFDLAPATLAFAATMAWFSGRNARGGLLAALGALVKLFPAVVAGPALVWEVSKLKASRVRGSLVFLCTMSFGVGCWWLLSGNGFRHSLEYHLNRGVQIESLYSGILMVLGKLTGAGMASHFDHLSFQIVTPWSDLAAALSLPIQAITLLFVLWRFYRSGMKDGMRYSAAAILAFLLTSKVLSPQFLIWLLPFMAVLEGKAGRNVRCLFLGACVLTALIYPWIYGELTHFAVGAILLLNLRNALLASILGLLLFSPPNIGRVIASVPAESVGMPTQDRDFQPAHYDN